MRSKPGVSKMDAATTLSLRANEAAFNASQGFPSNYIRTTKYTILTFLPLNLWEQFHRLSNVYFLVSMIVALIPGVSPIFPITSILPLVFVLTVGAIKDAVEDHGRYKADRAANSVPMYVLRGGVLEQVRTQDVTSGDIVFVEKGQVFPADLLLLSSSGREGQCYVETSNLDGETNLKLRQAAHVTVEYDNVEKLNRLKMRVEFEEPNEHLHEFKGRISVQVSEVVSGHPLPGSAGGPVGEGTKGEEKKEGEKDPSAAGDSSEHTSESAEGHGEHKRSFRRRRSSRKGLGMGGGGEGEGEGENIHEKHASLNETHLLLRGSSLRNTKWVYGFALYTGTDTKIFKNLKPKAHKFSALEHRLNQFVLFIFVLQQIACIFCSGMSVWFQKKTARDSFYLEGYNDYNDWELFVRNFLTFFVLFNVMIPISLFVSLELVRVAQALFMMWDDEMRHRGKRMIAKTSSLNDELARIEWVFSDKTGTLTENIMEFVKCSVIGHVHNETTCPGQLGQLALSQDSRIGKNTRDMMHDFLLCMLLCHDVVPEVDASSGVLLYESQSPDETALTEAARANGYELLQRSAEGLHVRIGGREMLYPVLAKLEFNADRKRMSIVTRENGGHGRLVLYTKGADSIMYERLSGENTDYVKNEVDDNLGMFAREGLRTLVLGKRYLKEKEFHSWLKRFHEAESSLEDRKMKVDAVCEQLEHSLTLLGCTAIEDKLQPEVPETIHYLLEAGVSVWVLTGDKRETAVNIAFSSKLLDSSTKVIHVAAKTSAECGEQIRKYIREFVPNGDSILSLREEIAKGYLDRSELKRKKRLLEHLLKQNSQHVKEGTKVHESSSLPPEDGSGGSGSGSGSRNGNARVGLVINGVSLQYALEDHLDDFVELSLACHCAICCRITPLQKALVVHLVEKRTNKIGLAIGDGANDVSMIQEAKVGIGIIGVEGTQAARASDYAIPQFRHLRRLLMVHGRYSYLRSGDLILYSFYKNMIVMFCQLFYTFYNGFTGQTLFDSWILLFYNMVFTALPPLILGIFEKDCPEEEIDRYPQVYRRYHDGVTCNWLQFWKYMGFSLVHSALVFFPLVSLFDEDAFVSNGRTSGIWFQGTMIVTILISIALLKNGIDTRSWTILNHIGIWGSFATYLGFLYWYSSLPSLMAQGNMYFIVQVMFSTPKFYMIFVLCVVGVLLVDMIYKYIQWQFFPVDWQLVLEKLELAKESKKTRESLESSHPSVI
eukprot:TRINITY_DN1044_c0_g1_i2.p1 TRINITY_DN1044_c0_g1~~TRINITY_DN1044_c0_g1_i2.p1  ORF type:complete len:1227 (-),score=333.71 TRINITY_DN1044_c0_g1_i2:190-3870(-)